MIDKKALSKAYRERTVVGGVYTVTNTKNNRCLLCSAADLKGAQNRYQFALATGGCIHPKLQEDWKEYGAQSFRFDIIEEIEKKDGQTDADFALDLAALQELIAERLDGNLQY